MLSTGAKDMALGFFADVAGGRYAQAFARLDDAARFEIVAPPPVGGVFDRQGLAAMAERYVHPMCMQPLQMEVIAITAEGERAALEVRSHAPLIDGTRYENRYHYLFIVRGGKIQRVCEYLDSAYLVRTMQRVAEFRIRNTTEKKRPRRDADSVSSQDATR